jgi:hypothetical protein
MSQPEKHPEDRGEQKGQPGKADVREYYARHLPHQVPRGFPIFLTWSLKGSLPKRVVAALEQERKGLEKQSRRQGETETQRRMRHSKILFAKRDRFLDTTQEGPKHLQDPRAAAIVVGSILWGVPERYQLYAYAVLSNHVHVVLTPAVDLEVITQGIKGYTAYRINGIQNQRGRVFWQDESYDHWARDEEEMLRIIEYVENNPVAAGLCSAAEQWPWSSAAWRRVLEWNAGEPLAEQWKDIILSACEDRVPDPLRGHR